MKNTKIKIILMLSIYGAGCASTYSVMTSDLMAQSPATKHQIRVAEVVDGDTFYIDSQEWSPFPNLKWKIRLTGIDTPEMKGDCVVERQAAKRATVLLTKILRDSDNIVTVENVRHDKYGGRFLADVYTKSGRQVSKEMLLSGLARPHHGVGKKTNWCEVLR